MLNLPCKPCKLGEREPYERKESLDRLRFFNSPLLQSTQRHAMTPDILIIFPAVASRFGRRSDGRDLCLHGGSSPRPKILSLRAKTGGDDNHHRSIVTWQCQCAYWFGRKYRGAYRTDGKLIIDSGYATSRAKITDALAKLSPDPIKHLVNTHWHFDHCDGNEWMHEDGAHILAHKNTRKHLATSTRVEGRDFTFPPHFQARFQVKFLPTKRHCTSMAPPSRSNITARAIRMAMSRPTSQKQMSFIAATPGGTVIIHSSIIPPAGTSKV